MISKQIAETAGELAELFATTPSSTDQQVLQYDIDCILIKNGIKEYKEEWWQK